MPPLTPRSRRAIRDPRPPFVLAVLVLDLARGDFLEGDRQVVLARRLDHRGRELVERPLTEVVVVRVDLASALGGDDHGGVVRVDLVKQLVDAGTDHALSVPRTMRASSATASSSGSFGTRCPTSGAAASSSSATRSRRSTDSGSSVP